MIYNGACKFIQLSGFDLPLQFRVLEDDIPIDYWIGTDDLSIYRPEDYTRPYYYYQCVNVDANIHGKEILTNLIVDDENQATSTLAGNKLTFYGESLEYVENLLTNWDILMFEYSSEWDIFYFRSGHHYKEQ